jgi:hypothetical protein
MKPKYTIWDFDGTLAYRDGMWSATLAAIVRREFPGSNATADVAGRGAKWSIPPQTVIVILVVAGTMTFAAAGL